MDRCSHEEERLAVIGPISERQGRVDTLLVQCIYPVPKEGRGLQTLPEVMSSERDTAPHDFHS